MNGKTAKLIRKAAQAQGIRSKRAIRAAKRQWKRLPWTERHAHRKKLEAICERRSG